MSSSLSQMRRASYRFGDILGNAQAIQRSFQTGSPKPLVKRALRRSAYRHTSHYLNRSLRQLGL